ncbi:MAG: FAD-dependent oxidoreductase [Candidatus Gracilibacteria bacterium]|nr:FAD-dependent oxidoreductase [Candidatus Gracilibacteria bacterium]
MYDLAIIGAGSAGLPAGIYSSRYKLKNIIIGELLGGALTQSHQVENYPGFEKISGSDLMNKFLEHAKISGSEVMNDKVIEISKSDKSFKLKTLSGKEIESRFLLIASGNKYRYLKVKGEQEFIGKGVSYCATCDGMFYRGREVVIVGGGNTAMTEALYLSEICMKVHIVHRSSSFGGEKVLIDRIMNHKNIEIILNDEVDEIKGGMFVEEVLLKSGKTLKVDGIFVAIGNEPETSVFDSLGIELDESGYIIVDPRQETSVKGVYAAGDITTNSNKFQQTLISSAEGALAANSIHEDMLKL